MIVIVFGAAASGKSTLAKALAERLHWDFVEGDDMHSSANKARMHAGIALDDSDRAPWLAILAQSIAEHIERGNSAVYACSALKRAYRAALIAPGVPAAAIRFVYLRATRAVLAERLDRRRGHFFPASLLDSQLRDLEEPVGDEPAPVLSVDATCAVDALVAQVIGRFQLRGVDSPAP